MTAPLDMKRASSALLAGAPLGAALTGGLIAIGAFVTEPMSWPLALFWGLLFAACSLVVWTAGLVLIAAPVWWLLHRLGARGWRTAVVTGAALPFGAGLVFAAAVTEAEVPLQRVAYAMGLGLIGSVVGFVVWRGAYRRAPDLGAEPHGLRG